MIGAFLFFGTRTITYDNKNFLANFLPDFSPQLYESLKRFTYFLCVLELSFIREMRIDSHCSGRISMAKILLRGEHIHTGAV